ncbi:MAG: 2-hydroxyacid dehydrogenase [bacterium]
MKTVSSALILGDAMIPSALFRPAFDRYLADYVETVEFGDWETNWDRLQRRRLEVEKNGPEVEEVPPEVKKTRDAQLLMGLFVPVSAAVMESLPELRIVGVCRAGLENVDVAAATRRGIVVCNVEGRNAQAVSDFAVGLLLAEVRNIARAHVSISRSEWRKEFSNSSMIPELKGKTVGIVGFGHIGRLVARKLSGFDVNLLVHDPFVSEQDLAQHNARGVEKQELFRESDFVTLHARLSDATRGLVGRRELELMKPTAYLVNTGRAGLVDHEALEHVLANGGIAGAGLDVFPDEPLPEDSGLRTLDNVTLTTHIAGTTTEALTNSPFLLMEDIRHLLEHGNSRFVVNPEVLETSAWA